MEHPRRVISATLSLASISILSVFEILEVPILTIRHWNTKNLRLEVKSGKQVNSTMSLFEKAETQSWEYELTKNNPKELFSLLAMPEGTKDGLFICRLSLIKKVVLELSQMWKEEKDNGLDKK